MTLIELVEHFKKYPSYLETGAPKLSKQLNVPLELIIQAKQEVRQMLKKEVIKEFDPVVTQSISLKDFAKMIGIDMDEDVEDYPEDVKIDTNFDLDLDLEEDGWEIKSKWIKNKEQSTLLVKKSIKSGIDYKKEFEIFLENAFKEKRFDWKYEQKEYIVDPQLCMVLCLFDVHIGRESYKSYTNDTTDLQQQQDDFAKSINKIFENLPYDKLEKIILPIGNDFFNIDTPQGTTTKGTPQDNTKDLHSMYYTGLNLLVEVIIYLSAMCEVEVILVPGNHDTTTSNFLATSLKVFFRDNPKVKVDDTPISRKYRQYGQTTLGFAHGELKMEKYAELLPYEAKEMFVSSKWYEYLLGDKHHEKSVQKEDGVVVRHLGGMTKSDVWTYNSGYTTSKRRAYGIIYHKEEGRMMEIIHQL